MKRLLKLAAAAFFATVGLTTTASAALYTGPVDTDQIISYGGYEWAWASPCGAVGGCSTFDISEQSTYGWRLPTASEVATYITSDITAFIDAFITPAGSQSYGGQSYACAAGWFNNTYSHCDVGDGYGGYIWNLNSSGGLYETFAIRSSLPPVPVPASLPLLFGALGGLGLMRRKAKRG